MCQVAPARAGGVEMEFWTSAWHAAFQRAHVLATQEGMRDVDTLHLIRAALDVDPELLADIDLAPHSSAQHLCEALASSDLPAPPTQRRGCRLLRRPSDYDNAAKTYLANNREDLVQGNITSPSGLSHLVSICLQPGSRASEALAARDVEVKPIIEQLRGRIIR